jgi:TrmH family RNA methyltransferase
MGKTRQDLRTEAFEATTLKNSFKDVSITVILIFPETSGNVGSICRVMQNFHFSNLILFHPICNPKDDQAYGLAMHGNNVLDHAEIIYCEDPNNEIPLLESIFNRFDIIIGTSAKGIDYKNIKRIPVFLHDLDFNQIPPQAKVALVFGRESTGLTNEQIIRTDFILKIAADEGYPTLNLAQAAAIILHSFYIHFHEIGRGFIRSASKQEKRRLTGVIENIIQNLPDDPSQYELSSIALKNLLGRSFLSWKELNTIYKLFREIDLVISGNIPISPKKSAYKPIDEFIKDEEDNEKN